MTPTPDAAMKPLTAPVQTQRVYNERLIKLEAEVHAKMAAA